MKRTGIILVFVLTLLLGLHTSSTVECYANEYVSREKLANELKELGLFLGTGEGFALEKPCDRLMGAVILVRFLGKEDEALSQENQHPFNDVKSTYANKYVGYLYNEGLVQGQTSNNYGTGVMTANEFATLMLRALDYKDNQDFTWNKAISKLSDIGIVSLKESAYMESKQFVREDAVLLCYETLLASPKGSVDALANKLLWENVFTTDQLGNTLDGKLMLAADMPDLIPNDTVVYNVKDLKDLIILSMKNNQLGVGIKAPGISKDTLMSVYEEIISEYHWKAVLGPSASYCWDGYIYPHIGLSDYLMMEFYYENPDRYEKSWHFYRTDLISENDGFIDMAEWAEKVNYIVSKNTSSNMSEIEKVRTLHDYLILNTEYDDSYDGEAFMTPHFAEQVIFEGQGVCDGYAEAFKILMNGAGIECKVIYGDTPYGLHAWNQVKIDNEWYNIDVTWDDPDYKNVISYNYFCVPDSVFLLEHKAESISKAEICNSTKYYD